MTDARDGDDVDAQAEYATDPALRELLSEAAGSPTVHRAANDGGDVDDPVLTEWAADIERLRPVDDLVVRDDGDAAGADDVDGTRVDGSAGFELIAAE